MCILYIFFIIHISIEGGGLTGTVPAMLVNEDGDDDAVNDDCETILYPQENETGLEGRGGWG